MDQTKASFSKWQLHQTGDHATVSKNQLFGDC
jgi:hypothetical protein